MMRKYKVDATIIPGTDPHQSEYISNHWKLRDWVSGFTGSNGTAVVTLDDAGLWTDSRYFLQAEIELQDSGFTMYKEDGGNDPTVNEWLAKNMKEGDVLAVNGKLFSLVQAGRLESFCGENGFRFAADFDPFPAIYTDRPELPLGKIFLHEEKYSGESTESKINRVLEACRRHGADATLLSALDEVAWTLNIRCNDVDFNPVAKESVDLPAFLSQGVIGQGLEVGYPAQERTHHPAFHDAHYLIGHWIPQGVPCIIKKCDSKRTAIMGNSCRQQLPFYPILRSPEEYHAKSKRTDYGCQRKNYERTLCLPKYCFQRSGSAR